MADYALIPLPLERPASDAFHENLDAMRHVWPFHEIALPTISRNDHASTRPPSAKQRFLQGYWTEYPTYCLIAYPVPDDTRAASLEVLRQVLVASHLLMLQSIEITGKHYQSRLRTSFRAFRHLCAANKQSVVARLPHDVETLAEYEQALVELTRQSDSEQDLHTLVLALEGAIAGRGGHTRVGGTGDANVIVGQSERLLANEEVAGRLMQDRKKINEDRIVTGNRLAHAESGSGPLLFMADAPVDAGGGESIYTAIRKSKAYTTSLMRLNQLLAFGWSRLSLFDIQAWFDNLRSACERIAPNHGMPAAELEAFCGLMFWTSRPVGEVRDLLMVANASFLPQSKLQAGYIVSDTGLALFPRLRPDGAKDVSEKWQAFVRPSADRVIIALPRAAREQVAAWLAQRLPSGTRGKRLFRLDGDSYASAIDALLRLLRKKHHARLTATRLARQLAISLANQTGDRVRAAAALGVAVGDHTTTGLYYYSATQSSLASAYWRTAAPISDHLVQSSTGEALPGLPINAEHTYVGTSVCPMVANAPKDSDFYACHVRDLRQALAFCRSRRHKPGYTVAFHNAYTSYCVTMLGAATGYRAVKDPLYAIHALDEPTGFLVISDKDFDDYRNARLTWAPPVLVAQLRAYAVYRTLLLRSLGLDETPRAFFFFLNDDRRPKQVAPHALATAVEWSSPLPLNANRHFLRTRLAESAVPGELIDAFMGHWDAGEQPFGPYSALSPAAFKTGIEPALTQIVQEQGWREEHVIDPALVPREFTSLADGQQREHDYPIKHPATPKPAHLRRDDLKRLEEIFVQLMFKLRAPDADRAFRNAEVATAFRALRHDPAIADWRFAHNRLAHRLDETRVKYRGAIDIPSAVTVVTQQPAPFTPDLFRGLADLRQFERRFAQSVRDLNPALPDIPNIVAEYLRPFRSARSRWVPDLAALLVGQILVSAARFGGLLSTHALRELLAQLPDGGLVIGDHLVFELTCRSLRRRWYADTLSCTLILRYRHLVARRKLPAFNRSVDDALRTIVRATMGGVCALEKVGFFLKSAGVAWRFDQPAFLYRWARNAASSCSWDLTTEMRVHFDRRIMATSASRQASEFVDEFDVDSAVRETEQPTCAARADRDLNRCYREFYDLLTVDTRASWRGQIARQIAAWLETNRAQIGPVATLFAQWIRAVVLRQSDSHQRIGAPSSLRTYVSRIGRTLFTQSRMLDSSDFQDLEAWTALYRLVVDSKCGPRSRMQAATECQAFHNYVVRTMDVPALRVGEAVGTGPTTIGASVNANYLTPFELARAVALLHQHAARDVNYELACHALELGYWSGLRIGELVNLQLRDVQITWSGIGQVKRVEILVQSHAGYATKTATSTRRVPLSSLMPMAALTRFVELVERRQQGRDDYSRSPREFILSPAAMGGARADPGEIRRLGQFAMRQITGDASLVFHHLRHSAANNMLIALMARSDDDPVWRLFARPPQALLEVSRRINRGLMINTQRRRGLLHAVETLLGHSSPSVTLQSYIHVLPWLSVLPSTPEKIAAIERDVDLDSSLLVKTDSATRSWRSRHDSSPLLQPLAAYWLEKFRSDAKPPVYKKTDKPLTAAEHDIPVPPRPLPSFHAIYRVAALVYQAEARAGRPSRGTELAKIASQTGLPLWLVFGLTHEMRYRSAHSALRSDVKFERAPHHNNRFSEVRRKFIRGHGPVALSILDQRPELHGLMPAFPRARVELAACEQLWRRLAGLLSENGLWQATGGGSAVEPDGESDLLLAAGLNTFLERTNSSDHTMKFFRTGLDAARRYIAFSKRISPHNRIMVELRPPRHMSPTKALANARKDLNLHGCFVRTTYRLARDYPNWPYGLPSVRLLSVTADPKIPKTLHASYGAWFAQYSFALIYNAVCEAYRFKRQFQSGPATHTP